MLIFLPTSMQNPGDNIAIYAPFGSVLYLNILTFWYLCKGFLKSLVKKHLLHLTKTHCVYHFIINVSFFLCFVIDSFVLIYPNKQFIFKNVRLRDKRIHFSVTVLSNIYVHTCDCVYVCVCSCALFKPVRARAELLAISNPIQQLHAWYDTHTHTHTYKNTRSHTVRYIFHTLSI